MGQLLLVSLIIVMITVMVVPGLMEREERGLEVTLEVALENTPNPSVLKLVVDHVFGEEVRDPAARFVAYAENSDNALAYAYSTSGDWVFDDVVFGLGENATCFLSHSEWGIEVGAEFEVRILDGLTDRYLFGPRLLRVRRAR